MSHYVVIVTGENVEQQLAPYEEGKVFFETKEGNRKAKWDWYEIGGRWLGFLPLKRGKIAILGKAGIFQNQPKEGGTDIAAIGDIDLSKLKAPFAVLHDKIWHERGEMGWFGAVGDEKDEKAWEKFSLEFIKKLPKNTKLTVIDCHI